MTPPLTNTVPRTQPRIALWQSCSTELPLVNAHYRHPGEVGSQRHKFF
jgi:hypothetical protein